MKRKASTSSWRLAVAIFIVLLSLLGLFVSYWYGIGWFMLFQTIREFLFAIPLFYIPLMKMTAGQDFANREKMRLENNQLFTSHAVARRALFSLAMTLLIFWKANIPIYKIIEMINRN